MDGYNKKNIINFDNKPQHKIKLIKKIKSKHV